MIDHLTSEVSRLNGMIAKIGGELRRARQERDRDDVTDAIHAAQKLVSDALCGKGVNDA
jgi:hypothetical protein